MLWYGPILQRQNSSFAHLAAPPLIAVLEATLAHTVRDAAERSFACTDLSESVAHLVCTERRWWLDFVETNFCLDWRVAVQL